MSPEKLELSELVAKFLVHKRSEGWSERTVEWYQQALATLPDMAGGGGDVHPP